MLKELEIPALGKRMRIAKEIAELKRQTNSELRAPSPRLADQSYASGSSMGMSPMPHNTSGLSEGFQNGPLSNGNMQTYLRQQQYQQPLPQNGQVGLGLPAVFDSLHGRHTSISSSAPSTMLDGSFAGNHGNYRSNAPWDHTQSPLVNQQTLDNHDGSVNGRLAKSIGGSTGTVDRGRTESDPGMLNGPPSATSPHPVGGLAEGWDRPRKGSLVCSSPLSGF